MIKEIMASVDHRPWVLPSNRWLMFQSWLDLLFMHWPVSSESLSPLIPAQLEIDCYDGQAWLGIVPFHMRNVRPRYAPALPWLSAFPELNVRTYVLGPVGTPKPGVYFFSLDAANPLAVEVARRWFHLPYFHARMSSTKHRRAIRYESQRRPLATNESDCPLGCFAATYEPVGEPFTPRAGTLEHWLTERYCLYTQDRKNRILRGEVHHRPWSLHPARCDISANTMALAAGVEITESAPLLHYARRIDAIFWPLSIVS